MHTISSINIKPIKPNSEKHNLREGKELDYVFYDRSNQNQSVIYENVSDYRSFLEKNTKEKTGRKMQKSATPIREGVLNLSKDSQMKDLIILSQKLEQTFGIKTLQIHIHEDEGRIEDGNFKQNRHAHMVFSWMDENSGKSLKLQKKDMSEIQDLVADTLKMERGASSNVKHLDSIQYKNQQEQLKLQQTIEKQTTAEQKAKMARTDLLKTKAKHQLVNTSETIKQAGSNLLKSISGQHSKTINQLKSEITDTKDALLSIKQDFVIVKKENTELHSIYYKLFQENSQLKSQSIELSKRFNQLNNTYHTLLENTKKLKLFKQNVGQWLINAFIKNDKEAFIKLKEAAKHLDVSQTPTQNKANNMSL